jgi:hypothetical protein
MNRTIISILVVLLLALVVSANSFEFVDNSLNRLLNITSDGNANLVGNLTADHFIGDGSQLTGIDTIGFFLDYTPITTTGNITNGSLNGYPAGNAICNAYYTGSHMCQTNEIINSINRNQSNENFTATVWISNGPPGYLSESYDCSGWTTPSGTSLGSIWVGSTSHVNSYGTGGLVNCGASRAISCCI